MKRSPLLVLAFIFLMLQDATLGEHYQAAFGFRISPVGWIAEMRKGWSVPTNLPEGFKGGTNSLTAVALPPEPTSAPPPPTTVPDPQLVVGALGFDQPNFGGANPKNLGQFGNQKFVIIGRAGKAPFPTTCFCVQVALKDDPTKTFWVLRLSIPFTDDKLDEYLNEVPDLMPPGATRPTL